MSIFITTHAGRHTMDKQAIINKHMERSTACINHYATKYGNIWTPTRNKAEAFDIYKDFFLDMLDRRDDCTRALLNDPHWECPDEIEEGTMGILTSLRGQAQWGE